MDGGEPAKSSTTTVLVLVQRNLYDPEFDPERVDITILETQALGMPVVMVNATDQDTKVCRRIWGRKSTK